MVEKYISHPEPNIREAQFMIALAIINRKPIPPEYMVSVVISSEDMDPVVDCVKYALGCEATVYTLFHLLSHSTCSQIPVPGSYAVYSSSNGEVNHIGRVTDDLMVISKWGRGDVYRHPPLHTPNFGDIEYFIPNEDY